MSNRKLKGKLHNPLKGTGILHIAKWYKLFLKRVKYKFLLYSFDTKHTQQYVIKWID